MWVMQHTILSLRTVHEMNMFSGGASSATETPLLAVTVTGSLASEMRLQWRSSAAAEALNSVWKGLLEALHIVSYVIGRCVYVN